MRSCYDHLPHENIYELSEVREERDLSIEARWTFAGKKFLLTMLRKQHKKREVIRVPRLYAHMLFLS